MRRSRQGEPIKITPCAAQRITDVPEQGCGPAVDLSVKCSSPCGDVDVRQADSIALIDDRVQPINRVIALMNQLVNLALTECEKQLVSSVLHALVRMHCIVQQPGNVRQGTPGLGNGKGELAKAEAASWSRCRVQIGNAPHHAASIIIRKLSGCNEELQILL